MDKLLFNVNGSLYCPYVKKSLKSGELLGAVDAAERVRPERVVDDSVDYCRDVPGGFHDP